MSAVVVRAKYGGDINGWVRSILSTAGVQNPTDLYWRNLPDYRKRIVVNELVQHPIRGFVQTASCRPNPQGLAFLFPSRL
ncbi:hypothetical protein IVA87_32085 [Bradyrhizobium sp. 147]|uniref:hypothetical protein n=1 Tax=unclassified Bradyrhizobium TaxID=2631580 RepID=UPI001FF78DAE|nr:MULTISPECIES: hypothetical protein [unclassified Bradyrhizobium]MCK1544539.1 hypothetical protein [Bradyrhizobium sp. 179]MCK1683895.1 hypothetical protein [Bradyrhizobium sp. 147]